MMRLPTVRGLVVLACTQFYSCTTSEWPCLGDEGPVAGTYVVADVGGDNEDLVGAEVIVATTTVSIHIEPSEGEAETITYLIGGEE